MSYTQERKEVLPESPYFIFIMNLFDIEMMMFAFAIVLFEDLWDILQHVFLWFSIFGVGEPGKSDVLAC